MKEPVTMSHSIRIAAAGLAALAAVSVVGQPAQARDPRADHRPCVANREANSAYAGQTRAQVERRWEVQGRGILVTTPLGFTAVAYKWCDHQFRDGSIIPNAYYIGAVYEHHKLQAVVWVKPTIYSEPDPAVVDPIPTPEPTTDPTTPPQPPTCKPGTCPVR